ncbi:MULTISPECIES: oligoendopeptidase F family protein [Shouchella]|jgi:oligoendopeptidase F|nr:MULTISPECIES: oligoendopeptidase F family protein [Shouchella]MDO7282661.1 oligoendopeptidase F family protein [Shouchella clausii]MDO7302758.1 oligoendopeptidase F family protein [Shouchella clausii]SHK94500.1 hypothetical protein SAMN05192535_0271 [Shouchella rhizosphaerae]
MKNVQKTLHRSDIPVEQTWNLNDLFATVEAWEIELTATSFLRA